MPHVAARDQLRVVIPDEVGIVQVVDVVTHEVPAAVVVYPAVAAVVYAVTHRVGENADVGRQVFMYQVAAGVHDGYGNRRTALVHVPGFNGANGAQIELIGKIRIVWRVQQARADGIVTSHEAEFVNALMDELELPLKARSEAMAYFEKGQRRQIELATELQRFAEAYPRGTEQGARLYDALLRLAAADGRVRPREREMLQEVTIRLGFDPAVLDDRLKRLGPGA